MTAETKRKDIMRVLAARLGAIPPDVGSAVKAIQDEAKLDDLLDCAASCPNLEEFRRQLA